MKVEKCNWRKINHHILIALNGTLGGRVSGLKKVNLGEVDRWIIEGVFNKRIPYRKQLSECELLRGHLNPVLGNTVVRVCVYANSPQIALDLLPGTDLLSFSPTKAEVQEAFDHVPPRETPLVLFS